MIKAIIKTEDRTVLVMGLQPRNFELLREGNPLVLQKSDLEAQPIDEFFFFFAETTADAEKYLAEFGITREKADVLVDNRCNKPDCPDCQ